VFGDTNLHRQVAVIGVEKQTVCAMVFRALGYSLLHFEVAVIVAEKKTVGVQ